MGSEYLLFTAHTLKALWRLLFPSAMRRETKLSQFEQGQITAVNETGMIPASYARRLKQLLNTLSRFLKNPAGYNAKQKWTAI